MTSNQIKLRIQNTFRSSMSSSTLFSRNSGIDYIFRDIHLFGREAGIDFVETYADELVREAIEVAKTRQISMQVTLSKSGKSALDGVAHALHELTGCVVAVSYSTVTLAWADDNYQVLP